VAPGVAAVIVVVAFLGMVARPIVALTAANRASDAQELGQREKAIDRLRVARRFDPLNAGYLHDLDGLYLRTRDVPAAVAVLERATEVEPDNAGYYTRLGLSRWIIGELPAAVEAFQRAVELDPWNGLSSNNLVGLALAYVATGRPDDAVALFKQAIFLDPLAAADPAWVPLADGRDRVLDPTYFQGGDPRRLRILLLTRLGLVIEDVPPPALPPPADRTVRLADVLESAYADYQAERNSDPQRAIGMLSALGRAYAAAGLHERAAELFADLVKDLPGESYAQYDLGLAYAALGRDADAARAFQTVVRLAEESSAYDPYRGFAHYQLGLIYRRAGDHERALQQFRATLEHYRWPYFPEAYLALAEAAAQTGHEDEAERTLNRLQYVLGEEALAEAGR
jgi:superkiller protein 3